MLLQRWDPIRDFERLHEEMDRVFRSLVTGRGASMQGDVTCSFAVDIFEDKDQVLLKAELPGVNPKDVSLHVEGNVLTISGEKRLEFEEKKDSYVRIERGYGRFSRSFTLPPYVDSNQVTAEYADGVLTVSLPKRPETKPRQIEVKKK